MRKILLAVALLLGVSSVDAGMFTTGNDLLRLINDCDRLKAGQQTYETFYACGAALWYVRGVADFIDTLEDETGVGRICFAHKVNSDQLVAITKKYLQNNPSFLHIAADGLVFDALEKAFPCPK